MCPFTELLETTKKERLSDSLQNKVQLVEDELRRGYRQEALTLNAAIENLTRIYLTRLQTLEKEFRSAQLELDQAEKQQMEAQKTHFELLHQNWQLLKTLQQLRQSLEKSDHRKDRRTWIASEIPRWKRAGSPNRHYLL
ncbi:Hypothetical predicted protein [Pelobates cultripes]|uniref:Uncharacterized protein n=1 Tax=Pelobates cultripes TaxID=61616 RepID=A0AAD1RP09_PELCU|nr:Hypothetical predicted protein [Pelobates cultripes]